MLFSYFLHIVGYLEVWKNDMRAYLFHNTRNNTTVNTESQFGTQCWLAGKFRSFEACMENSCARIKKMSLVNFLKFVVREEFVYVWLCR